MEWALTAAGVDHRASWLESPDDFHVEGFEEIVPYICRICC
jgi:hypothetical protein